MEEKKRKVGWYFIAIGIIVLFLLMLISSILNVGDRLASIHPHVPYLFYLICAILIWLLIINPCRIVIFSPTLSIATTLENDSKKAHKIYRSVTKNILSNTEVTLKDEERLALMDYKDYAELREALNLVMSGTIKKEIDRIIIRNAKTVLLSTAISQNSKIDMYSIISVNLKMIKEIVTVCGFRPNMKNLSKLVINVASTALIAEGLESLKMEDVLPSNIINSISNIPLLKPVLSSFVQGVANALLTIRIGLVARGYLFTDSKKASKFSIRAEAFKDALIMLPIVVGEIIVFFPSKIVRLFAPKDKKDEKSTTTSVSTT